MAIKRTLDLVYIGLFTAITTVCAWITVPAVVPFTLQSFAVLLGVGLLGWKRALISVTAYLSLGALGVPVFSGFTGGFGILLGATGGFLWGFLAMIPLVGLLLGSSPSLPRLILCMMAGLLLCYLFGAVYFFAVYAGGRIGLGEVLLTTVVPFLLPDAVKLVLAAWISLKCKRFLK